MFVVNEGGAVFHVEVRYSSNRVGVQTLAISVSNALHECLCASEVLDRIGRNEGLKRELSTVHLATQRAAARVVKLLKYHLDHVFIGEQLCALISIDWKDGSREWSSLPILLDATISGRAAFPLDPRVVSHIQRELDESFTPLAGLRHLHRARNEDLPHYKWIDATIAAELCIKEILIRKHELLAELLLELPSPRLDLLYGRIMKTYLGVESPYKRKLAEGAKTRNDLVHRPDTTRVTGQEAIDYVRVVECAVIHALRRVYPSDALLELMESAVQNRHPPINYPRR